MNNYILGPFYIGARKREGVLEARASMDCSRPQMYQPSDSLVGVQKQQTQRHPHRDPYIKQTQRQCFAIHVHLFGQIWTNNRFWPFGRMEIVIWIILEF